MEKTTIRISVPNRGFGMSLGNMIDLVFGDAEAKLEDNWIEVEEYKPSVFKVVDNNMTENGNWVTEATALGFSQWDDEVQDIDGVEDYPSDESQCFGMSNHLQWKDVDLMPYVFCAPSIERLKEALTHVAICAWCPGDI